MYLEKLEIQGFKSFANGSELFFNRELTAIVGPNGSGKSNIADAVRWVLGEQSSKTLRGKKSEDVIFAGSDKKGRLGFAQVSLYLNNQDHLAEVDFEQIIITRKVDRNGESEYLINNSRVRLMDVQLLLAKANFGQKTYSVIGQGMIDSILTSSSAERKEFFDEATGVRQFQIKKDQSINKLEGAKNNLSQTSQILNELEPHLRSLTRQVKRLEKREQLIRDLNNLQTDYYSFLSNQLNGELSNHKEQYQISVKEVSNLNQKLVDLQTSLEKEEKGRSRQDSFDHLQNRLSQAQDELNSSLKEKAIIEGQMDVQLISTGQVDIVWLKKRLDTLANEVNLQNLHLEEKQHRQKQTQEQVLELENKQKVILADFKKLEDEVKNNNDEWSNEKISHKVTALLDKQQDFERALENIDALDKLESLKKLCQQITASLWEVKNYFSRPAKNTNQDWTEKFNQLLLTKDNMVAEVNEAKTRLAMADQEIVLINQQLNKDKQELIKLENERKNLAENKQDNKGLKDQLEILLAKIDSQNKKIASIEKEVRAFNEQEEKKKSSLVQSQKDFREIQQEFNTKNSKLNEIKVVLARLETKQEDLNREIGEEMVDFQAKKVGPVDTDASRVQIASLKNQLQIIGGIDPSIVEEYSQVNERYQFLKTQSDDLNEAIAHLEKIIKDLDESISKQFDQAFHNINKLFDAYFKKLFAGGKAELILDIKENIISNGEEAESVDGEIPEKKIQKQYGIEIKATPPGKRLSGISMLSGGEKALTSIALICAIIANNPSPFVFLDEVDAALDEANSVRFSQILQEISNKTQFIAITHNRATMHHAKIIYGVTMGDDGVSKLLSMSFDQADEIAAK
jgi:chromosome segregation protein